MTSAVPVRPGWPADPEGPDDGWERGLAYGMLQLVVAVLLAAGAVLALRLVTQSGYGAGREFSDFGGDPARGLQLGLLCALLSSAMVVAAAGVCLVRLGRSRYLLSGWGLLLVEAVLALCLGIMAFLRGIGGMGGPPPVLPAAQQFGTVVSGLLSEGQIVLLMAVLLGACLLRGPHRRRSSPLWWTAIAAVLAGAGAATVVFVAYLLPR